LPWLVFAFADDLAFVDFEPFDFELAFPFVFALVVGLSVVACVVGACVDVVVVGHGPIVSPWRMCAGSAELLTVIVTRGFFAECVWWQIVTLPEYW
jgi:hypothetical protein